MLQKHQIESIASVQKDKVVHIHPFNPATQIVAKEITSRITSMFPDADVFHIGSSKLGIAGENDIDMTVVMGKEFGPALRTFEAWYGEPTKTALHDNYAYWKFEQGGFPIELHLIDVKKPYFEEQLKTQTLFEENRGLTSEYEQMKLGCDGLPYCEYLKRKYEFWNRIIEDSDSHGVREAAQRYHHIVLVHNGNSRTISILFL